MKVMVEAVDNGFIVRQIQEDDEPIKHEVFQFDDDGFGYNYERAIPNAIVSAAWSIFNMLGHFTSDHKPFNHRFIVVDKEGNEVD